MTARFVSLIGYLLASIPGFFELAAIHCAPPFHAGFKEPLKYAVEKSLGLTNVERWHLKLVLYNADTATSGKQKTPEEHQARVASVLEMCKAAQMKFDKTEGGMTGQKIEDVS
ncbi:hypothetical protein NUU61_003736 [Penicillium alfredii]|uniref:Uncharacterized protein n=1 Tax=Penicillium alfredii TaxID=1506179 RepID=A0A9W9FJT4_9EURO|nr:uncharacterized protein NUU61_003736 [Penicillium alfredii]KAJ5101514.1 hypothetical protein NUU61_003736 [Penicillium alfredii]